MAYNERVSRIVAICNPGPKTYDEILSALPDNAAGESPDPGFQQALAKAIPWLVAQGYLRRSTSSSGLPAYSATAKNRNGLGLKMVI